MSKHTPTPWRASHGTGPVMQSYSQSSCIAGTRNNALQLVAGCFNDIGGEDMAAANAELIVKSVNSHEQLIEALKLAKTALLHSSPGLSHYPEPVKRHADAEKAVSEALAAVGAK